MPASLKDASLMGNVEIGLNDTFLKIVKFWEDEDDNGPAIPMDMYTACACGEFSYVRQLLLDGADVDRPNIEQWTALAYASFCGHDNVVNLLLERSKVDVNKCTGASHMTCLMWAAACNHESIMSSLLQHGADIEAEDSDGRTSLIWAIITDQKSTLEALITAGADIEHMDGKYGRSPLLVAVAEKAEALVEILLSRGADVNAVDRNNRNAMYLAQQPPASTAILNLLEAASRRVRASADPGFRSEPGLSLGLDSLTIDDNDGLNIRNPPSPSPDSRVLPKFNSVDEFLSYLGLDKYINLFNKQNITFDMILDMNEAKLKTLGLSLFGPRRKIYFAAQRFKEEYK